MSEQVYPAEKLTLTHDIADSGIVSRTQFDPPYPANGSPLAQLLWSAGEAQDALGCTIEVVQTGTWWPRYDFRLIRDGGWSRIYGPFTAGQAQAYLRGLVDGYRRSYGG